MIDAACGSSLAAIRMAIMELTDYRADMMITGGIDTDNSIASYTCFSKTPAFSKSDRVRTFDEKSDGMMVGEGLGMVVLKRLKDAERDGDRIYAVIKGMGSSSDGRYKSIYAPRSEGQAIAVRRAYKEAGFTPDTLGLIEAHGTGTVAGDPAEMAGLKLVYGDYEVKKNSIALGSIKSNIGHTKAAAGTAGMIKASLALHQKVLPATINVDKPNPKFGLDETPLYVNSETRPWIQASNSYPRRAGVSAFGFGGTNFHMVLEEYQPEHKHAYRMQNKNQMVILKAASPEALQTKCVETLQTISTENGEKAYYDLVLASKSLSIEKNDARVGFVAQNRKDAIGKLQMAVDLFAKNSGQNSWSHPNGLTYRKSSADVDGKVVAMFSGQGSQYVNMGSDLAMNFPVIREQFGNMDAIFNTDGESPLSSVVYPVPVFDDESHKAQDVNLRNTRNAQPAIGTMSMGLFKILKDAGLDVNYCLGHSFGELTALWASGVFSDEDYQKAAKARGNAMAAPVDESFDAGTMLAVKGDVEKLPELIKDFATIKIANFNSPLQVVLAGATKELQEVQGVLTENGYSVFPLSVSAAFHTSLVAHAQKPFAAALKKLTFNAPTVPVYSNTTAGKYPLDPKKIQTMLGKHMLESVQFTQQIQQVFDDGGRVFIEFGPKAVITNLVKDILKDHLDEIQMIALNPNAKADSDLQLRQAVIALKISGVTLGDIDPYALLQEPKELAKDAKGMISLSAGGYKSEKTSKAFEEAIAKTEKLQGFVNQNAIQIQEQEPIEILEPVQQEASVEENYMPADGALERFQEQQTEALRLHEQYLQNESTYTEVFAQLTTQQLQLAQQSIETPEQNDQLSMVLKSVTRNMDRFHQHQQETARLHEQYIDNHSDFTRSFTQLLKTSKVVTVPGQRERKIVGQGGNGNGSGNGSGNGNGKSNQASISQPSIVRSSTTVAETKTLPVVEETASFPAAIANSQNIFDTLLAIVAEKTGYPQEMIDPQMDMESDLGIDSIKRVEILGALQEAFPELPEVPVDQLSSTRTLQEIADLMQKNAGEMPQLPTEKDAQSQDVEVTQTAIPSDVDLMGLIQSIIAEKTGYPVEMLEPEMDMESDLGIDSIKKVEIMGTLQETVPQAAEIPAETLAGLRSMKDIQEALTTFVGEAKAVPEAAPQVESTVFSESEPVTAAEVKAVDKETFMNSLINIVAEKTGYPAEMLEPDMNLEADLGIDSIKRVEILGALQEAHPDLPALETEELAELDTLQKIQEVLEKKASAGSKPGIQTESVQAVNATNLAVYEVQVQRLPVPDQLVMTFPENAVYLIVDQGMNSGTAYSEALEEFGWQTAMVNLPWQNNIKQNATNIDQFKLSAVDDANIEKLLGEIHAKYSNIAGIIFFANSDAAESVQHFINEDSLQISQLAFLLAKHLQPDLNLFHEQYRNSFVTVVQNDGSFGKTSANTSDPLAGGLSGLVKTLSLEWPTVLCRSVDFAKESSIEVMVQKTIQEILDPNLAVCEVGYIDGKRVTLDAQRQMSGGKA